MADAGASVPAAPGVAAEPTKPDGQLSLAARYPVIVKAIAKQPWSWPRCLLAIFSYALLLTDTLRTGVAIFGLPQYSVLESSTVVYFGPFDYPVIHLNTTNATADTREGYWGYKYDSTSITMRAVAQLLRVREWPPCVLYQDPPCDEVKGMTRLELFQMLDGIISSVRAHQPLGATTKHERGHLGIRLDYQWIDRLNERVLPWAFRRAVQRTVRIASFRLQDGLHVCGREMQHGIWCSQVWRGGCDQTPGDAKCRGAHHGWSPLSKQLGFLREVYPNATIEAVTFEGYDDFSHGALLLQGQQRRDIVLLSRIRDCTPDGTCKTVAVDDYRFEDGIMGTNAPDFAYIIAFLRGTGQLYTWARFLLLLKGVFNVTSGIESSVFSAKRWIAAIRIFFLVPSQVVVYGSAFPIVCYVGAHVLDAPLVQKIVRAHFGSVNGVYQLKVGQVVDIGSVSLRGVWLVGFCGHVISKLRQQRSWTAVKGVLGIPEFLVTLLVASTIFSQMRVKTWRNSKVLQAQEVAWSPSFSAVRTHRLHSRDSTITQILAAATVDVQFFSVSLGVAILAAVGIRVFHALLPRFPIQLSVVSLTRVPYSCGFLWPSNALIVSWFGTIISTAVLSKDLAENADKSPRLRLGSAAVVRLLQPRPFIQRQQRSAEDRVADQLTDLRRRGEHIDCLIFLINLTVMTDLLTWKALRTDSSYLIGVYHSPVTKRVFLMPLAAETSNANIPVNWASLKLIAVAPAHLLPWWELLLCG
ncbi:hypothetical protein PINS_up005588 [Pythium insidiosum]|nr:hypothetical protein PINS_up005588 [Pythium insidiosum]